jgi:hypothetical protein
MTDAITAYWTGFAAGGDPNDGAGAPPAWPRYGAAGTRQILNLKISQTTDSTLNCPLWDSIGYNQASASLY